MNIKNYLLLALLVVTSFFVFPSALPSDIMEERNLVTAREMAYDGHWMLPTMNGEPRLEKPPLPTWVAGVVELALPGSLSAQRAAASVVACIGLLFFFLIISDLGGARFAYLASIVLLTMYQTVLMGRTATWDIYCHSFMLGAIFFLERGLRQSARRQWRWMPAAGLMLGLSFLSKGPVSFYAMLLPVVLACIGLSGLSMRGKWPSLVVMLVIMTLVGGWWYAWLFNEHPAEVAAVIHKESGAWSNHNVRPWWYYWRFFLETGVWAVLVLTALAVSYWKRHLHEPRTYLFAVTWLIAALILLSLMPEKKMRYLLPLMPPCSLCAACLIRHLDEVRDRVSRTLLNIQSLLTELLPVTVASMLLIRRPLGTWCSVLLALIFLCVTALAVRAALEHSACRLVNCTALTFVLTECFLLAPVGKLFGNPQAHSIALSVNSAEVRDMPLYHPADETVRIELVYAAGRKILPIDLKSARALMQKEPFVLISRRPATNYMAPQARNMITLKPIGTFDDNKHPNTDRHYTADLQGNITLVEARNNDKP